MSGINNKKYGRTDGYGTVLKILLCILILLLLISVLKTCRDCSVNKIIDQTGYLPEDENWDNIPDIEPPYDDEDLDSLPDAVSLEQYFPPIGDQNPYGTCVAWAVGYNLKTALNAIENHWTKEQLERSEYQTSPRDLWYCIPQDGKGPRCGGTTFESAFSALMSDKGVATMDVVPYGNMGNCNGVGSGNPKNRIESYGRVVSEGALPRVEYFKAYLKDTVPVVFGAKLGDRFMQWDDNSVLKADTYNNPNMMHAFHAMVLVGYDDGKHAFRVRNSWGTSWGDNGSIWVDYDFFTNDFCFAAFIVKNKNINNK